MYAPHKTGRESAHASTAASVTASMDAPAIAAVAALADPADYARHDLVWLSEAGWLAARACASADDAAALARWQRNDWPAIVRRRDADLCTPATLHERTGLTNKDGGDQICLGIPLPPDPGTGAKRRIALRAQLSEVARVSPPAPLFSCLPAAGPWQTDLGVLADRAAGLQLRTYGSLAMQTLTGLPCFTASSDIDLLFAPADTHQLQQGLDLLAHFAARLPLDGEIIFPGACAVSWKEWLSAVNSRSRVLAKEMTRVRLADPAELLASLEAR